jgi:hypothetical protein
MRGVPDCRGGSGVSGCGLEDTVDGEREKGGGGKSPYVSLDPVVELGIVPRRGHRRVVLGWLGPRHHNAQHLGVAQGVFARADVGQAGVDAGHDDGFAAAGAGWFKDVLERLRQGALSEGNVGGLLGGLAREPVGVGEGAAAD